jgi:NAD(P)-dependent dehydrogenase (short-subunit alcohol dehydrogenase family)
MKHAAPHDGKTATERSNYMPDLTGKVALITGAGGGIGQAAAVRFTAAGARVGLTDLDKDALAGTAAPLSDGAAVTVAGDITDPATIDELATAAAASFGRVDALFNARAFCRCRGSWAGRHRRHRPARPRRRRRVSPGRRRTS